MLVLGLRKAILSYILAPCKVYLFVVISVKYASRDNHHKNHTRH